MSLHKAHTWCQYSTLSTELYECSSYIMLLRRRNIVCQMSSLQLHISRIVSVELDTFGKA